MADIDMTNRDPNGINAHLGVSLKHLNFLLFEFTVINFMNTNSEQVSKWYIVKC